MATLASDDPITALAVRQAELDKASFSRLILGTERAPASAGELLQKIAIWL